MMTRFVIPAKRVRKTAFRCGSVLTLIIVLLLMFSFIQIDVHPGSSNFGNNKEFPLALEHAQHNTQQKSYSAAMSHDRSSRFPAPRNDELHIHIAGDRSQWGDPVERKTMKVNIEEKYIKELTTEVYNKMTDARYLGCIYKVGEPDSQHEDIPSVEECMSFCHGMGVQHVAYQKPTCKCFQAPQLYRRLDTTCRHYKDGAVVGYELYSAYIPDGVHDWTPWMNNRHLGKTVRYRGCERGQTGMLCKPEYQKQLLNKTDLHLPSGVSYAGCFTREAIVAEKEEGAIFAVDILDCISQCSSEQYLYAAMLDQSDVECLCLRNLGYSEPCALCQTATFGMLVYHLPHREVHLQFSPPIQPTRVALVAHWRSGSTLTAELLSHYPSSLYVYEPGATYGLTYPSDEISATNLLLIEMFKKYTTCDLWNVPPIYYLTWKVLYRSSRYTIEPMNCFSKLSHSGDAGLCIPYMIEKCKRSQLISAKFIRLSETRAITKLAVDMPDVKFVNLVRDPRGILASRIRFFSRPMFTRPHMRSAMHSLCNEVVSLHRLFSGDLGNTSMTVFFEELALDPTTAAYSIYKFLRVRFPISVHGYLSSLSSWNAGTFDTSRKDPEGIISKWKKTLPHQLISLVNGVCRDFFIEMNYTGLYMIA